MHLRRLFWALFAILLFAPLVANLVLIRLDSLLRDVLFVEGFLLLILGAQSGEYIWNWFKGKRGYPTELKAGLTLLAFGSAYVLIAFLLPAGVIR